MFIAGVKKGTFQHWYKSVENIFWSTRYVSIIARGKKLFLFFALLTAGWLLLWFFLRGGKNMKSEPRIARYQVGIYAVWNINLRVNIEEICLTWHVKMGYNWFMLTNIISFILRISLVGTFWFCVWRYVEPRTQSMRILRAALLVLGMLVILAMVKITG